jgi:hypothetical protein
MRSDTTTTVRDGTVEGFVTPTYGWRRAVAWAVAIGGSWAAAGLLAVATLAGPPLAQLAACAVIGFVGVRLVRS